MDDAADPGFSRAPQLEDLTSLCRALNREGARYVLIGGFAVILHGLVRTTKDIDLLVFFARQHTEGETSSRLPSRQRRRARRR